MANPFAILVSNLSQLGFFGFLLPFLLIFTIVFALLLKSKTLGEDKRIIGVISLIIGFFVIGYGGPVLGNFFVTLFGSAAVILAGMLVIVLFVAMSGGIDKLGSSKIAMAVAAVLGIIIFVVAIGSFGVNINNDVVAIVFVIVLLGAAIYFIAGKE